MKLEKLPLSANLRFCKIHIKIPQLHMGIGPGPALQVAVFKCALASMALQCGYIVG
jgi:hypothetical protein